jgi:hypothetical protein
MFGNTVKLPLSPSKHNSRVLEMNKYGIIGFGYKMWRRYGDDGTSPVLPKS